MRFLIPKSRAGTLWRVFFAALILVGCGAATTAVAGLLEVKTLAGLIAVNPAIKSKQIPLPAAGKPQTLLLIGSDHRYGASTSTANTDTMLLIRLNAASSTINMLSIPRDLQVTINGETQKLNAAYSEGSYNLLLQTIHQQVFPKLKVNHIIDTNFTGFSDIIDALGCVYSDVDHRYYNVSEPGEDDFSAIDIEPGYQKLCGHNESVHGALPFVRFRHTDSDLMREARQQDFIRWAKGQFSTSELISKRDQLFKIIGRHSTTDHDLHTGDGLLELFDLVLHSDASSIRQIAFPAGTLTSDGIDYVTSTPSAEAQAFAQFMKPTKAPRTKSREHPATAKKHHRAARIDTAGLESDPNDGLAQAQALTDPRMPVFYPTLIVAPIVIPQYDWQPEYCSSAIGNCDSDIEPATAYEHSYPRQYVIPTSGNTDKVPAYRMTVQLNGITDSYYGIQGVAWRNPPLLKNPSATRIVKGRKLLLYAAGGKLTTVAWHLGKDSYWISNDLTSDIPNHEMVALAASMVRSR
jgi:LCP family protein required for cell wall assembly